MRRLATVGAVCLSFVLAGTVSVLAQDEHHDREEEHKKAEHKKEEHKEVRQEERHDQHVEARREEHAEHRRIADEHFRAHFGHEHHFAVRHITVVKGQRRFEYGGYRFGLVESWPVAWGYSDDCYIDFVDGEYYLFNLRHPGVRIVVNVLP